MLKMRGHCQHFCSWNKRNGLNEHFPTIVNMFSQPIFILKNFRYDVIFEEGKKAKVGQSKA